MKQPQLPTIHEEGILLLFEGSLHAIPFNIFLAFLLAIDIIYARVPVHRVLLWLLVVCIVSFIRWFFCHQGIKLRLYKAKTPLNLYIFLILTFCMGVTWGSCYFVMLPYINELHEFIILLVFGGMCCGAIVSLSAYLPAYGLYILPMFLPVIIYNYWLMTPDRAILATMFSLFVIMVMISAMLNNKLLNQTFRLSTEKESLIKKLKQLSITDGLTGLYNRRHFEDVLEKEIDIGKQNKYSLNLISIDVDNFKLVNDNFGHPYGDKIIIYLAELLKQSLKGSTDMIFRIGGDEFSVILARASIRETLEICDRIRTQFNAKINLPHHQKFCSHLAVFDKLTLSIGVVYIPFDCPSNNINNAVIAVDQALYQSKQEGKDRIILKKL